MAILFMSSFCLPLGAGVKGIEAHEHLTGRPLLYYRGSIVTNNDHIKTDHVFWIVPLSMDIKIAFFK